MPKSNFVFPPPYNDGLSVSTTSGYHKLNSLRPVRIGANLPIVWAPQAGYTSHTGSTTRISAKFTRDLINWRLQFVGYSRPSSFVDPIEPDFNPYEVIVTYQTLAADGVTVSGPVRELMSAGRKWFRVNPGTDTYTDACGEFMPAGQLAYFYVWINTRISTGTTINGETGQLSADSANFPRFDGVGGQANMTTCGSRFTNSATIDTSYNSTATGVFTVNTTSGSGPVSIVGECLDETGNASIFWCGDSISQGSNAIVPYSTEAWSGLGVVYKLLAGNYACYNAGLNSTSAVSWLSYYKVRHRTLNLINADTFVYWLGTNDFATGGTFAQVQAAAIQTAALARDAGVKRVVALTCLYRYTSTDGYQTFDNQTQSGGATFVANATAWNDWLLSSDQDTFDAVIDVVPLVQDRTQGGKYKLSTVLQSGLTAAGSTSTVINVAETLTTNAFMGRHFFIAGDTVQYRISSNTTTSITVATALAGGAPAAGVAYKVLASMTDDGTHPTQFGCNTIAAGINPTIFNYR